MKRIDLNVDIGEGYRFDDALLEFASSANVCCGEHAGSWDLTLETAEKCRSSGIRVGAHPGYPDRENMGRRSPTPDERQDWEASVRDQIDRFRREVGGAYVKPHGAFYNELAALGADQVGDVLRRYGLTEGSVMVLAGSPAAIALGERALAEGFADRRQGSRVAWRCLHGDTAGCVELARAVVRALHDAGWEVGA